MKEEMKEESSAKDQNHQTLKQAIELNEDEIEELDDDEIEKNLKIPTNFEEIEESSFPLFLTVK